METIESHVILCGLFITELPVWPPKCYPHLQPSDAHECTRARVQRRTQWSPHANRTRARWRWSGLADCCACWRWSRRSHPPASSTAQCRCSGGRTCGGWPSARLWRQPRADAATWRGLRHARPPLDSPACGGGSARGDGRPVHSAGPTRRRRVALGRAWPPCVDRRTRQVSCSPLTGCFPSWAALVRSFLRRVKRR